MLVVMVVAAAVTATAAAAVAAAAGDMALQLRRLRYHLVEGLPQLHAARRFYLNVG
jgi:hypothetical protein